MNDFIIGVVCSMAAMACLGWVVAREIERQEEQELVQVQIPDEGLIARLAMPDPICDTWAVQDGNAVRCIWYFKEESNESISK